MTESYDALIVGAGPAGLSAALILGRCRRKVLLCDSGLHRNSASQAIHGLLGHEGRPPSELLTIGSKELKKYASVTHARLEVSAIAPFNGGFTFTHLDGKGFARKVLLATGLVDEVPDLVGVDALYGRSVHHCLYCDGFEHRDEPIAAYGAGDKGAGLALMMTQWSPDVILCTGGEGEVTPPMKQRLAEHGIKIFLGSDCGARGRVRQAQTDSPSERGSHRALRSVFHDGLPPEIRPIEDPRLPARRKGRRYHRPVD